MAATSIDNPPPLSTDSKSARKKKAKGDTAATTASPAAIIAAQVAATSNGASSDVPSVDGAKVDPDSPNEHAYVRELAKQVRNINKKLAGLQKTDAVVAENPGVSLDELVATKKINADQKASMLKKPQLKEQLDQLESQIRHYREFEAEFQGRFAKQKQDIEAEHQRALDKAREEAKLTASTAGTAELKQKLLVFSQFLRCAAHKRTVEEDMDTDENRAFEGALLLVYGGDQKAVDTALHIVNGSDEPVPTIEGIELPIKYSQIRQAALEHPPYQAEETWIEQVAEANAGPISTEPAGSDPTITHAGLNELDAQPNGASTADAAPAFTSLDSAGAAGNLAGERWDSTAAGADSASLDDSYEMVPRPQDELEVPASAAAPTTTTTLEGKTSWADEASAFDAGGASTGNRAGESWDTKAAGQKADNWPADAVARSTAPTAAATKTEAPTVAGADADGFHAVAGRHRGAGRGNGNGEFRGRGGGRGGRGGFRGDGDFRGRGRGGFRGGRGGAGGEGEFRGRGRGGRGRGGAAVEGAAPPRGGA